MRPIYESAESISAEESVGQRIALAWGVEMKRLPKFYPCDFMALRGGTLAGWVEVKCRSKKYKTLHLSLHKAMSLQEISSKTGLPAVVVASVPEGLFLWVVAAQLPEIVWAGRADRGDEQDMEPCINIPYGDMKLIKEI